MDFTVYARVRYRLAMETLLVPTIAQKRMYQILGKSAAKTVPLASK